MMSKETDRPNIKSKIQEPPDGGWGWMVVFGSAFLNIFHLSFALVFGMIYGDAIKDMGEGTKGSTLVINMSFLLQNCFGPITGQLIKKWSCRTVAVLGTFLAAVGIILTSFATSLWHMVFYYGILRGTGMSMLTTATFVAINSYFKKNKGKAIGFSACGAGIGQALMPYAIRYLMDEYSYRGTALIMGALCFNGIAGALLFEPVERHMKKPIDNIEEEVIFLHEKNPDTANLSKKTDSSFKGDEECKKSIINSDITAKGNKKTMKAKILGIVSSMDLELLKQWRFLTIIIGNSLAFVSALNFVSLTPFILNDMLKLSSQKIVIVLSVMSGSDVLFRMIIPIITDKLKIKAVSSCLISCVLLAIVRQIMTLNINFTTVLVLSVLHGIGKTLLLVNQYISVADECRQDQVPSAVGLYMMAKGITILPFGYFAGWIRDYLGDFIISVTFLNAMLVFVVLMFIPQIIIDYRIKRNEKILHEIHDYNNDS